MLFDILIKEIRLCRKVHILTKLFNTVVLEAFFIAFDNLEESGEVILLLDNLSQIILDGPFRMSVHHWHEVGFIIGIAGK